MAEKDVVESVDPVDAQDNWEDEEDWEDGELNLTAKHWLSIALFIGLLMFTIGCMVFDIFG